MFCVINFLVFRTSESGSGMSGWMRFINGFQTYLTAVINPLPTNDAYMRHELHKNLYGGLILGVNTLYRLLCFFKLFPMVGKGLTGRSNKL